MNAALSSHTAFVQALDRARSIELCSYSLGAGSSVARALERAGDRGAAVSVTLEGEPLGPASGDGIARANLAVASDLRAHGVRVRLAGPQDERLHLKAAVVDRMAYLDDRNWPESGDTIVATRDRAAVAAVASALGGDPASVDAPLATEKAAALRLEAEAIAHAAGGFVDVETESFGACAVASALRARALAGEHVRLILSARAFRRATPGERAEAYRLARAGVEIRLGHSDQKLCVGGDRGWVGSANATFAPEAMLDWGLQTRDRAVLEGLARAFSRDWCAARPLRDAELSVASQDGRSRSR